MSSMTRKAFVQGYNAYVGSLHVFCSATIEHANLDVAAVPAVLKGL